MVAKLQKKFLEESYPSANHIHIKGADRRMIYKKPSAISQHLRKLVHQQQAIQRVTPGAAYDTPDTDREIFGYRSNVQ